LSKVRAHVRVRFFGTLRIVTSTRDLVVILEEENTVRDLLRRLSDKVGPRFQKVVFESKDLHILSRNMFIIINGRNIMQLNGLDTRLQNGDVISIVPPITGG